MKKTLFIKNAAVMTVSSVILRFAGIVFKVWLAGKIGAQGMGLHQLIFSLYILAAAFTQSGIPTAVTKLVAGEEALGSRSGIKRIMSLNFKINMILSAVTSAVLFFGADFFADRIISDPRAALSIKVLSFSIFFMGAAAIIKGYFIARRKAAPTAAAGLTEQFVRIGATVAAVGAARKQGLTVVLAAVFLGDCAAEAVSALYLFLRYRFDIRRIKTEGAEHTQRPLSQVTAIALPLTAGRYLNSLLRTTENMLVPRALKKYSEKGAMALFGMIKGMALPVLFFPSVILNTASTLLIPEMTEAKERKLTGLVRCAVEDIITSAAVVGILFSAIFATCGHKIGILLYKSADVGFLICALAPIVPLMYIDSLCDGMLKGLDQQKFTFRVSVSDSAIRIILILIFLEKSGINGFISIMYFSNLLTCILNVRRLVKISGAAVNMQKAVIIPVISAFAAALTIKTILNLFSMSNLVYIIIMCGVCTVLYMIPVSYFGCISVFNLSRVRPHRIHTAAKTRTSLIK